MAMAREDVIATLQRNRATLEQRGVVHAAVFGSVARNQARDDSDIDILIEIDPQKPMDVFAYSGLKGFIADFFPLPVDVVTRSALKETIRDNAQEDAMYAF